MQSIPETEFSECRIAYLAMAANQVGYEVNLVVIRRNFFNNFKVGEA
jgi:hypothetical protein